MNGDAAKAFLSVVGEVCRYYWSVFVDDWETVARTKGSNFALDLGFRSDEQKISVYVGDWETVARTKWSNFAL